MIDLHPGQGRHELEALVLERAKHAEPDPAKVHHLLARWSTVSRTWPLAGALCSVRVGVGSDHVEAWWCGCCLGSGTSRLTAQHGGATTTQGHDLAVAANALAQGEMYHLKAVHRGLIDAVRSPRLARAASISCPPASEIAIGAPTQLQLEAFLDRGEAIASAVDERYRRLSAAVTSDPVFEGDLLEELRAVVVDNGPTHHAAFATLHAILGSLPPIDLLRATRRKPNDMFEQHLLDVSDRSYALTITALEMAFAQEDSFIAASFRELEFSAMGSLDAINRADPPRSHR